MVRPRGDKIEEKTMGPESIYTIPAGTDIGHVHLKVADLDRALRFAAALQRAQ